MKLLIAGLPGAGKTTFGEFLSCLKGFKHIDLDKEGPHNYPIEGDVVCTWGFIPDNVTHTRLLDDLSFAGYKFIWFDDGGLSSYKKYIAREGNTYNKNWLYFRQIFKIEKYKYHSAAADYLKAMNNSYKKLKTKLANAEQAYRRDIRELIYRPESFKSFIIRGRTTTEDQLEKALWAGTIKH